MNEDPYYIARVRVLSGHTCAETAYVLHGHPWPSQWTTRYWIETGTSGSQARGQHRLVSQTAKGKGTWNKPRLSTYSPIKVMYLNDLDKVKTHDVPLTITGPGDARTRAMGVYDRLPDHLRDKYDALLAISRKTNPYTWTEWETIVAELARYIARYDGGTPKIVNGVWHVNGTPRRHLSDPAAYITAARELITAS